MLRSVGRPGARKLRWSHSRAPNTLASVVNTSASQPAASARSTTSRVIAGSLNTYSCIHSRPPSEVHSAARALATVLRQNGTPAACAARASSTSPRGRIMPLSPVGPTMIGSASGAPNSVVRAWRPAVSTSVRGTKW